MSEKPSSAPSTAWTIPVEEALVKLAEDAPVLWKCRNDADLGDEEKEKITYICEAINEHFETGFTDAMVTKKWLELALLFDLKYAINGYTMADRGKNKTRNGTIIDDMTESWIHFHKLSFLIGSRQRPKNNNKKN